MQYIEEGMLVICIKDLKVIWNITVLFACNFYPFVSPATTVIAEGHNYNDLVGFLELTFKLYKQCPHPILPPLQEAKHKAHCFTGDIVLQRDRC